jgi:hypothetical protein
MATATQGPIDVVALADRAVGYPSGAAASALVCLGDQLGLYRAALADVGPASSGELAAATGLDERWVREWLHGQAGTGLVDHVGEATSSSPPNRPHCSPTRITRPSSREDSGCCSPFSSGGNGCTDPSGPGAARPTTTSGGSTPATRSGSVPRGCGRTWSRSSCLGSTA